MIASAVDIRDFFHRSALGTAILTARQSRARAWWMGTLVYVGCCHGILLALLAVVRSLFGNSAIRDWYQSHSRCIGNGHAKRKEFISDSLKRRSDATLRSGNKLFPQ